MNKRYLFSGLESQLDIKHRIDIFQGYKDLSRFEFRISDSIIHFKYKKYFNYYYEYFEIKGKDKIRIFKINQSLG